jgi:hypothetical protein
MFPMNATFPLRKSYILKGAILSTTFCVIVLFHIMLPLLPNLKEVERVPLMIMAWGPAMVVYGGMFLVSIYVLVAAVRTKVIIHGNRVTDIGVFRQKEFDLQEVTSARWQARRRIKKPRLVVATPAGRVLFDFHIHRNDDARQLIQFFRSGLSTEIQEGWTSEWEELLNSFDATSSSLGSSKIPLWKLPWARFVGSAWIAGLGSGLMGGLLLWVMTSNLSVTPSTWSGSLLVDWTAYGLAVSVAITIPIAALLALERMGARLDK